MWSGGNLPHSAQRQHDPDATALTGSPNAEADRIHPVDEFVLDFTASHESAHIGHLHRFADTVSRS
jgi:hypothetical protein